MPANIGELSRTQDESFVQVKVKLHNGVSLNSLDIFTHSEYIKLNAPPFYREIFLFKPIEETESRCKIIDRIVYFHLKKKTPVHWTEVEFDLQDKSVKKDVKEQVVHEVQEKNQRLVDERSNRKVEIKRKDMLTEIDRQSRDRERKQQAVDSIREQIHPSTPSVVVTSPKTRPAVLKTIPAVRESGSITITFTDRVFPTPKRESQSQLEEEWLVKQMEAKRITGFVEEDLGDDERDPQWLTNKANGFYKSGNYKAAISAYTSAIKLTPKAYELYLNRAGAQYCEGNFMRCAEDCSKALELLVPKVEPNKKARIQCLARRGAALCKMGLLREGWCEMDAAWKLDKTNGSLREDLNKIEEILRSKGDMSE